MTTKKPDFEASVAALETIIADLEQGQLPLEEAITRYEKGVTIVKNCQSMLEKAEQKR